MTNEPTEVRDLLRLKRYEQPSEDYFEDFVDEFHRRQREELLKRSARSLLAERLSVWLREMGVAKWAYGAGLAYAVLMVGFFVWPRGGTEHQAISPVLSGWTGNAQPWPKNALPFSLMVTLPIHRSGPMETRR